MLDINLKERKIKAEDLLPLFRTLLVCPSPIVLRLSNNNMTTACVSVLTKFLSQRPKLQELHLESCHMSDSDGAAIADALCLDDGPCTEYLTTIDLAGNELGHAFAQTMGDTLNILGARCSVVVLRLSSNNLQRHSELIVQNLQYNKSIRKLDLASNGIGSTVQRSVLSALEKNTTLTRLNLRHNRLSSKMLLRLDAALEENRQRLKESQARRADALDDTRRQELLLEAEVGLELSQTPNTRRLLKEMAVFDGAGAGTGQRGVSALHPDRQVDPATPDRTLPYPGLDDVYPGLEGESPEPAELGLVEPREVGEAEAEDRYAVANSALHAIAALEKRHHDRTPAPPAVDYAGMMEAVSAATETAETFTLDAGAVPRLRYEDVLQYAATTVRTLLADGRDVVPAEGATFLIQLLGELGTRCRAYEERVGTFARQTVDSQRRLASEVDMLRQEREIKEGVPPRPMRTPGH